MTNAVGQLKKELNEAKDRNRSILPKHAVDVLDESTSELAASDIVAKALKVGDIAPDFTLNNQTGKPVQLYELLKDGAVVLTFYRGGWCPYCNLALRGLQRLEKKFLEKGARIVAISPELPDNTLSTAEKNELTFDVLSDQGLVVAKSFKIAFTVSDSVDTMFKETLSNDLSKQNGAEGAKQLPLPASFVIGQDKKIKFAFVDVDFTNRMEPEDALAVL